MSDLFIYIVLYFVVGVAVMSLTVALAPDKIGGIDPGDVVLYWPAFIGAHVVYGTGRFLQRLWERKEGTP